MKNFPNKINLIIVLLLSTVITAMSQNYSQTGTSSTFFNIGTFTFVNSGTFSTDADAVGQVDNNSGTISFMGSDNEFTDNSYDADGADALGVSSGQRVTGTVAYSGTATQNVQSRYYTELNMNNAGEKDFPDNLFVGGTYTIEGNSGDRDYDANSGTFTYDGAALQPIAGENGATNSYNHLFFDGAGTKRLDNGNTAQASGSITMLSSNSGGVSIRGSLIGDGDFTQEASAGEFVIEGTDGNASASFGAGAVSLGANVSLNNDGNEARFRTGSGGTSIAAAGVVTVTSGTFHVEDGSLDLATGSSNSFALVNDADAAISVGSGQTFTVNQGGFANARAVGSRTNMYFDDASTVAYSDGGKAVITDATNQYGNLTFDGSGTTTVETDANQIYMSGNLTVNDANLALNYGGAGLSNTLTMTDEDATASYGTGFEVVGLMKRTNGGSDLSTSKTLTMNNAATSIDLSAVTGLTEVALDVRPRGGTDKAVTGFSDYDDTRDIDRSMKFFYTTTGDFDANISYGYTDGNNGTYDETSSFAGAGQAAILAGMRFREDNGDNTSGKVSTGNSIYRNTSNDPFNNVYLTGIKRSGDNTASSGALATVENGGLVFLRGGPTIFISINHGRWSNPGTWDEGEQPKETDIAVVRHNVHIGYQRLTDANSAVNENTGVTSGDISQGIISKIIIDDDYDNLTKTDEASLMVGGNVTAKIVEDATVDQIFGTGYSGGLINNESQTAAVEEPASINADVTDNTPTNSGFVVFGGATFELEGSFQNNNFGVYNGGNVRVGK